MSRVFVWALFSALPYGYLYADTRAISFPVAGTHRFSNDFAEPRDSGARSHEGVDIIADKMTPVVAVTDGEVTFVASPEPSWGYSVTVRDADGYRYRYLHLNNDTPGTDDGRGGEVNAYAPGITRGVSVKRGQLLGWVGDSGNAELVSAHLHFEIHTPGGQAVNPYDSLIAADIGVISLPLADIKKVVIPLQEGASTKEVKALHEALNRLGVYTGNLDTTYTSNTREAVRTFQKTHELPATGIADTLTQQKIFEASARIPNDSASVPYLFTRDLEVGSSGEEVRALQRYLNAQGFTVAKSGEGSAGKESLYFGARTRAALAAFQKSKGITPAAGYFGPKTRAAVR